MVAKRIQIYGAKITGKCIFKSKIESRHIYTPRQKSLPDPFPRVMQKTCSTTKGAAAIKSHLEMYCIKSPFLKHVNKCTFC